MARVLLCCENYAPSVGGVQEVMRQIAERTAAAGHDVSVATTSHPQREDGCVINGVQVRSFRMGGNLAKGLSGDVDGFRRYLLDTRPDVIMIKAAQQCTFDAALAVIEDIDATKVFIPCGFSGLGAPEYEDYYAAMPTYMAKFDKLIFYATAYKDIDMARGAGLSQLEIIPNGVDETEFFADTGNGVARQGRAGLTFLTVGNRIVPKGHWEVLDAFDTVHADVPLTLLLNGNSPHRSAARAIAGSLRDTLRGYLPLGMLVSLANLRFKLRGEPKRVVLTDYKRAGLLQAYRQADVFLFASHVEYSPLVLFEAAASGTPFISADVGNAREIAQWTGAGRVVTPATPVVGRKAVSSAFADAVQMLINDPDSMQAMAAAGRATIAADYCWNSIVRRYWHAMGIEPFAVTSASERDLGGRRDDKQSEHEHRAGVADRGEAAHGSARRHNQVAHFRLLGVRARKLLCAAR